MMNGLPHRNLRRLPISRALILQTQPHLIMMMIMLMMMMMMMTMMTMIMMIIMMVRMIMSTIMNRI